MRSLKTLKYGWSWTALCAMFALPLMAADVYVSDERGNDATGNGSYEQPYKTIQKGVDEASAGDTIKILRGIYGEGEEHYDGSQTNRVLITKKLTLEGVEGKEVTHIVGRHQPGATTDKEKMGTAAIRCIRIKDSSAAGTIIKNLTIRDGAVQNGDDVLSSYGGGVCGYEKSTKTCFYLVDCVVSNCAACWGGAIHGGTAVRCLFKNNFGVGPGGTARHASLLNCLVVRSKNLNASARPAVAYSILVNSTVYGTLSNGMGLAYQNYAYNSISFGNSSTDINAAGTGTADNKTVTNSYNTAAYAYTLFSPASGDCRITEGSPAAGGGLTEFVTSKITLPAGIDANIDLAGNTIDLSKTTCDAGCYQGAVTPAGGRIMFLSTGWIVNGERHETGGTTVYYTPETWPISVTARPLVANVTNYVYSGTSNGYFAHNKNRRYFPLMDGSHVLTPPPDAADTLRLTPQTATFVVYAKPDANAAEADGTLEHPFRTLQDAIVCVTNSSSSGERPLILALPGTYAEGGEVIGGVFTRLVIPDAKSFTIRSTDGAARTVIKGGADESNTGYYAGCGPAAVRCIHISRGSVTVTPSAVQGFTIADGHTLCEDYGTDSDPHRGGGILATAQNAWVSQILDCIITNCAAVRCGASYNVTMFRCKLYDCHGYGGVMRSTRLISCYVDPSCTLGSAPADAPANGVLGNSTTTYLTTAPEATAFNSSALSLYSSLFASLDPGTSPTLWGSVTTNAAAATSTKGCAYVHIPNFVDPANNDWRLRTTTPVRTECKLPAKDAAAYATWAVNIAYTFQGDIEGNPMSVTDGKPLPGCWQTTVGDKCVFVSAKKGGLSLSDGCNVDDPANFPLTVSPGTGSRPCIGYEAGGVTNLFETGNGTITAADVAASDYGLILYAIYSNDWYVNPHDGVGDDLNDGFRPSTPMKTLAAVMQKVSSGDTVHAAAGSYAEGSAMVGGDNAAWNMGARVVVPSGVTLVADEGPEVTFIVGAPESDSEKANEYGMGTNALRCVFMRSNARLKGFTVTGGRTWWDYTGFDNTARDYSGNWSGGGICGHSYGREDVYVEDCIISNNYARWAGATRFANLIRCRLFENYALNNGGALRDAHAYGCIIDRNYSGSGSGRASCYFYTRIVGSTLGPHNYKLDGSEAQAVNGASSDKAVFHDNLVLGSTGAKGNLTNTVTGCVFANSSNGWPTNETCIVVPSDELQVDDDLRPIVGRNAAVDRGSLEALATHTKGLLPSEVDALGFQRVMNGTVDVGALEGDWRPMYAKLLDGKGRRLQITAADPGVCTNDVGGVAAVVLHDGEDLSFAWSMSKRSAPRRGKVRVTGTGTLALTHNGETFATFTAADGVTEFTLPAAWLDALAFAFDGEGSADLFGFAAPVGTAVSFR